MFLKDFCDISKERVNKIINEFVIKKRISNIILKKADYSLCPDSCENKYIKSSCKCKSINCPLLTLQSIDTVVTNTNDCLKLSKDMIIKEEYKKHPVFGDKEIIKLSKYQILQFLTFHFLVKRKDGLIKNVSYSEIAKFLNCSLNTVSSNSLILKELGLVSIEKKDIDTYDIKIIGYEDYFRTKDEGGTGYIQITKEFLLNILSLDKDTFTVNVIRIALKELLDYDSKRIQKLYALDENENNYTNEKTIKELRDFLPKRFYKKTIIKIFNILEKANIFICKIKDRVISIKPTKLANGHILSNERRKQFSNALKEKVSKINNVLNDEDTKKLIDISIFFGLNNVNNVLDLFITSEKSQELIETGKDIALYVRQKLNMIN